MPNAFGKQISLQNSRVIARRNRSLPQFSSQLGTHAQHSDVCEENSSPIVNFYDARELPNWTDPAIHYARQLRKFAIKFDTNGRATDFNDLADQ